MEKKNLSTPVSTVTRDIASLASTVGNTYETVVIIAKRANQISAEMKSELETRLRDFRGFTDNLEEIHENREQIEVSRYYEKLPKATLRAIKEFEENKIYYRNPLHSAEI